MTAKIISTYYSGGYSLNSKYSKLTITASGGIGGAGLYAGSFARIFNDGVVHGAGASNGIFLNAGGFVQNGDSVVTDALIEGADGIVVNGAAGTVVNYGTIDGLGGGTGNVAAYAGIYLSNGGSVVNGAAGDVTALIEGANGVVVQGALGRITNFGTIQSTGIDGRAVYLLGGGTATNGSASDATALIVGDRFGVLSGGASVKIANFGTIQSTFSLGQGVYLAAGGTVTNGSADDTTALISSAYEGVRARPASTTIVNYGTIQGLGDRANNYNASGIRLVAGGTVTNGSVADTTALIECYRGAGIFSSGATTIANFGTIQGTGHYGGVYLYVEGTVTNGSAADTTALIEGGEFGVFASSKSTTTVTNFGTISGTNAAVLFAVAGDTLVVEAGCAFQGAVLGGAGKLVLATGPGTISDLTGGNATVSGSMATTTFSNFGTLSIGSRAQFTLTGAGTIASGATATLIDAGTFTVAGALTVAGKVSGLGTLTLAGGTMEVDAGAAISVAHWILKSGTTTINTTLTYNGGGATGDFETGVFSTLTVAKGDRLTLTGRTNLAGTVNGAGTVTVADIDAGSHAVTSGLVIGGTVMLDDVGVVGQLGDLFLGDGTSNSATLEIAAGAAWVIELDSGVARGASTSSSIKNSGRLIKSGGTGLSVIGVKVADTGSLEAATGILDFTAALSGTGAMFVDSGATLEVDSTAASTLSMTFNGGNGVLTLKAPASFKATINGFAPADTIDLLGKTATAAVLGAGDTLVITNGTHAVATLQLAGNYTGDTFSVASDDHGGTDITVTAGAAFVTPPPAVLPFVAAMAGLAGRAAGGPGSTWLEGDHQGHHQPLCAPGRGCVA